MFSAAKLHVMYQVLNASVRRFPFPHLYVENVFPADFYAEIRRNMIEDAAYTRLVDSGRVGKGYSGARFSLFPEELEQNVADTAKKQFWKSVFETFGNAEFGQIWLSVFGPTINEKFKTLPKALSGDRPVNEIPLLNEIFLMRDRTTYSLGPHTDTPRKVVSVLFYLPPDEAMIDLGTSVYVPKDRRFVCHSGLHHSFDLFDLVATMPYKPNSMIAFPQSPRSFHGVEPLEKADALRDLLLFDLKIQPPGPAA